jgi:hypothetical protein
MRWQWHALDQMEERGISRAQAEEVLRTGAIVKGPYPGRANDWLARIAQRVGNRSIGVVVSIFPSRVWVITAMWEDRQ